MQPLRGIVAAMITPFDPRGGVDGPALAQLTEALVQAGVQALYPLGTTGEAFLMTVEERQEVAEIVVRQTAGRVPVAIHVGALKTMDAVRLARHAENIGASGIGAVTPSYYPVNEREMVEYYAAIVRAVPPSFPVYLYNIPQCSGNHLSVEVVKYLAKAFPNLVGIKNSTPDLLLFQQYLSASPGFDALIGCDQLILASLAIGGAGAVSGNVNVFPEPYVALYQAFQAGDLALARQLQGYITTIAAALKNGASLAHFKAGLEYRGLSGGSVRYPLLDLTAEERTRLFTDLEALGLAKTFTAGKEDQP